MRGKTKPPFEKGRSGQSLLLKTVFSGVADRTVPIFGHILPAGRGCNAAAGVTGFFIVNIAACFTNILFHRNHLPAASMRGSIGYDARSGFIHMLWTKHAAFTA